ncbi:MAG: DUF3256 family protein [Paludibacteraceae bacterium]|nr:DUF3256 family protein [Paludibacteraceae bacterium]
MEQVKKSENIVWWLAVVFVMSILLLLTGLARANDTTQVVYDVISTRDTLITNDSIIVIHTVCAPICSSHARIYNKEWQEIGVLKAPFKSIFPEAYIENEKLLWRDNDTLSYSPIP